jgi:hypothetical protein
MSKCMTNSMEMGPSLEAATAWRVFRLRRRLSDMEGSREYTVTCFTGVTIRRGLDWMIGFIALIHSTRNYKQL